MRLGMSFPLTSLLAVALRYTTVPDSGLWEIHGCVQ